MAKQVDRRKFLGTAGIATGLGMMAQSGHTDDSTPPPLASKTGGVRQDLEKLVRSTPFVDTHEHLWEESRRIQTKTQKEIVPAPDFGMLFSHYSDSDLRVSRQSEDDYHKMISYPLAPRSEWKLVQPIMTDAAIPATNCASAKAFAPSMAKTICVKTIARPYRKNWQRKSSRDSTRVF